jgi:stage II sporulation protein D
LRFPIAKSLPVAALLAALTLPAAGADAAGRFWVRGAGYGHGIGMSQYGAQGYALHGWTYRAILRHYYTGTRLASVAPGRRAWVLVASGGALRVTHASRADGRALDPGHAYVVRAGGGGVAIYATSGRRVARLGAAGTLTGPRGFTRVEGRGYRGAMRFDAVSGGVRAVNVLSLDDYTRGVIAGEMPASWELEALKAQAVAARTYALAEGRGILYPDTRSQVYRGMRGETARTNAAVRATRGRVVTYAGQPAVTFYFSTSGGRTENVEDSFIGATPRPWLKSVSDPYDSISPLHRWTLRFTIASAARRLSGLVRGRFKGITVLQRGGSPRIVRAAVVGTRGRTIVTGPTLRARLNAYDTWMTFASITSRVSAARVSAASPSPGPPRGASPGVVSAHSALAARVVTLSGQVLYGASGAGLRVERWTEAGWTWAAHIRLGRGGRYAWKTRHAGRYRVVYAGLAGPAQTVRL